MRRFYSMIISISFLFMITSCDYKAKKEANAFFSDLKVEHFKNEYKNNGNIYSVFLSNNSPWVYNTLETEEEIIVIVKKERSFVYLNQLSANQQDALKYDYYKFIYKKDTQKLFFFLEDETIEEVILMDHHLNGIVKTASLHLNRDEELLTFDSFYPIIKELFENKKASELEISGKTNKRVSVTFKNEELLAKLPSFNEHLLNIYSNETYHQIATSIIENTYNSVLITINWNSKTNEIYPYFKIGRMHLNYYEISPTSIVFE